MDKNLHSTWTHGMNSSKVIAILIVLIAGFLMPRLPAADPIAILVEPASVSVPELGTAIFKVSLSAQPATNVLVTITRTSGDEGLTAGTRWGGNQVYFSPSGWNVPQTLYVEEADDADLSSETATFTCTADGLTSAELTATSDDNDTTLTVNAGTGGTATPSGSTIVTKDLGIEVTATADAGYSFTEWTVISGVATFNNSTAPVTNVTINVPTEIQANFTSAISLVTTLASKHEISVPENGTAAFDVKLSKQPPSDVTVTNICTLVDGSTGISLTGGASMTFTSVTWDTYQTVTLSAPHDDDTIEARATITCSASGLSTVTANALCEDDETTLTLSSNSADYGTVEPAGATVVAKNVAINIKAIPAAGYNFNSWSGTTGATIAASTAASTTATLSQAATVTANFNMKSPTSPIQHTIRVTATAQEATPSITLNWPAIDFQGISIYRKTLQATNWGVVYATVSSSATSFVDTGVTVGTGYEYKVQSCGGNVYGYVYAGIKMPLVDSRGKIILLVDSSMVAPLATEIQRLERDLAGDGWIVLRHDVARQWSTANAATADEVAAIKTIIDADYNSDPDNVKAVLIFGRVPLPYSGNIAPDGHSNHYGAWPADVYYAQIGETWTDTQSLSTNGRNSNQPGDGKFDQSYFTQSATKLVVGRVDMSAMTAFSKTETELLRSYLEKDHSFRQRDVVYEPYCVVDDNFGEFSGEAFSQNGWRISTLVGATNTVAGDFFTDTASKKMLWAYGCGPGSYTSCGGVGATSDFASKSPQAVFTVLFGSYFGDYDSSDNFMRASMASSGAGLTCVWGGRSNWFFHHMGMGEPIGMSVYLMLSNSLYAQGSSIHRDFLGDPSLRLHTLAPPSGVILAGATVSWTASADAATDGFQGYHVYRAADIAGTFTRLTASVVSGTSWTDPSPLADAIYQVRAIRLETSTTGTYFNNSQGVFSVSDDKSTIVASPKSLNVPEGGTATFQVKLSMPPDVDTTVTVSRSAGDEDITVTGGASLTFSPTDWNIFQTVTLSAAEDTDAESGSTTILCSAEGLLSATVIASELDNEALYTLTVVSGTGGGKYKMGTLVDISADTPLALKIFDKWTGDIANLADASLAATTVTMPLADMTVTANYKDMPLGLLTDISTVEIPEGATATFGVKLNRQPPGDVTVACVKNGGDADITITSGESLTFTTANWDTYQLVTLSAAEDNDADKGTATFTLSSTGLTDLTVTATEIENECTLTMANDGNGTTTPFVATIVTVKADTAIAAVPSIGYHFINWTVTAGTANIADEKATDTTVAIDTDATVQANFELNSVSIVTDLDTVNVPEGSTATFKLKLSAQPVGYVTVKVSRSEGDTDINVSGNSSFVFSSLNWDTFRTVTLAAINDNDTANGSATIKCAATSLEDKIVTANEVDNDTLQILTNVSTLSVPEGGTATFNVKLSLQPAADVPVTVANTAGDADISVTTGSALVFTTVNWDTYQAVTVSAASDADNTGASATITCSSPIADSAEVKATESDNDRTLLITAVNGTVSKTPDSTYYKTGSTVELKSVPDVGYKFESWSGDASGTDDPIVVTMNSDKNITANFAQLPSVVMTMASSPAGTGATTPSEGAHNVITTVGQSIKATPSKGYEFQTWSFKGGVTVADASSAETTATLTADGTLTANFAVIVPKSVLTVIGGSGGGTYAVGSKAIIIADEPVAGKQFDKWTGVPADVVFSNANLAVTTVTMPVSDVTVTATYVDSQCILTVVNGTGSGSFASGTKAPIEADTAPDGKTFLLWTIAPPEAVIGDASSQKTTVTVDCNTTVTANYADASAGTIFLSSPNGGEKFSAGDVVAVQWVSDKLAGNVKIDLFKGGAFSSTISGSTDAATGSFEWTIPETQVSGTDYRVKVSSIEDSSANDSSDADFAISSGSTATLTMAAEPSGKGTTYPDIGTHAVSTGQAVSIAAVPMANYRFFRWKATTLAKIADPLSQSTTVILSGDATVAAYFTFDFTVSDFGKVKIKLDATKPGNDSVSIVKSGIPDDITEKDFAITEFSFLLMIDDYSVEMNQSTGILKKVGKKSVYTYKPNKTSEQVALVISMVPGARFWSLKGAKLKIGASVDTMDDVDIYLGVADKLFGDTIPMDEVMQWKYAKGKDLNSSSTVLDAGGTPINGFDITEAICKTVNNVQGKDSFSVTKALSEPIAEFTGVEDVFIGIDDWFEPLENIQKSGEKDVYKAKGLTVDGAKYSLELNFEKKTWTFRLMSATDLADLVMDADGIDVILWVGDSASGLRLQGSKKTTLSYPKK